MAKPRVFISSTYYDLRYVRADLERFVRELGYDPICHEAGAVPYTREAPLEESAYREVSLSDIVVCLLGGRHGTVSSTREGSITQNELKLALANGIQVYLFVEANVLSEYSTYQLNKATDGIKYKHVDNPAVYQFLEEVHSLPQNNPITAFTSSADICGFLRSQWAGLFQHFLKEQRRIPEIKVLEEMKLVAGTLQQLVAFFTAERRDKDGSVQNILFANHPLFRKLAGLLNTGYRVFFTNKLEMDSWLRARQYVPIDEIAWDEDSAAEWRNVADKKYLKLSEKVFDDDGSLKSYTEQNWKDEWVELRDLPPEEGPSLGLKEFLS